MRQRGKMFHITLAVWGAAALFAAAQTTSYWNNAAGGAWHTAANWTPANVPDTPTEEAFIERDGTYLVTIDRSQFPDGLATRYVQIASNAPSVTATVVAVNTAIGQELRWQIGTNGLNFNARPPSVPGRHRRQG